MKFALFLKSIDARVPSEYRGRFMNYRQLKKQIRYTDKRDEESRNNFFLAMRDELDRVNRVFEKQLRRIRRSSHRFNCHRQLYDCIGCCTPEWAAERKKREAALLLQQAFWCRQYARINAQGLRKILKKYDKRMGGQEGMQFLQTCWGGSNLEMGTILHSPMLNDLAGLQVRLKASNHVRVGRKVQVLVRPSVFSHAVKVAPAAAAQEERLSAMQGGWEDAADCEAQGIASSSSVAMDGAQGGARAAVAEGEGGGEGKEGHVAGSGGKQQGNSGDDVLVPAHSSGESEEDEPVQLDCPVCMSKMHHPVGLSCGHTFCERCVIRTIDMQHVLGPLRTLLARVPDDVTCPECRQPGVFHNAMLLRELDGLVKLRHPQDWQQGAQEEWSRKQALLRMYVRQQLKRTCTFADQPSQTHSVTSIITMLERVDVEGDVSFTNGSFTSRQSQQHHGSSP